MLFCVWLLLQSVMFVISIMLFRSLIILIAIYFSVLKISQSLFITVTITGHTVFSNLRLLWLKFLCVFVCMCVSYMYVSNAKSFQSCPLFATLWTVACQSPLLVGFSWQEYWSGLPFPPPWDPPNTGTEAASPVSSTGRWILYQWVTWEVQSCYMCCAVLCLVAQLCLILCTAKTAACQGALSMGILQPRILEWVAMPSSCCYIHLGKYL